MRIRLPFLVLSALSLMVSACSSSPKPASDRPKAEVKAQAAPEDVSQYRFFAVACPQGKLSDNLLAYDLWKAPPQTRDALKFVPETEYFVGVERDATPADSALADLAFTDPKGLTVETTVFKKTFSTERRLFYQYGVFFPSVQADGVWDGTVRWVWEEGLRIFPPAGSKTISFGSYPAKSDQFVQPMVPPLVRGSEIEVQVVAANHQATRIRKVFRVTGRAFSGLRVGLRDMNERKEEQFPSRFTEVSASEAAHPDIQIKLAAGSATTARIPFTNSEAIFSSFMSCATRHSAPAFLAVDVSFDGWDGPQVKLSAKVKAAPEAPKGDRYFRVIHRASWDKGTIYKERIARVSVE